jgi:hypothetical protein
MKKLLIILCLGTMMISADSVKKAPAMPAGLTSAMMGNPIKVRYTNYRGETAVRTIVPMSFYFGSTEYHKEEQWLVKLWDVERAAERIYALREITEWFVQ